MKKLLLFTLVCLFTLSSVGCSLSYTTSSRASEITVFYGQMGWGSTEHYEGIIDKAKKIFETKFSDVKVNLEPFVNDGQSSYSKIVTDKINSDDEKIDIFFTSPYQSFALSSDGLTLHIDDLINKNRDYFKDIYEEGTLDKAKTGDSFYGLPIASKTSALYYSKSILDKYNIDLKPNWTWDDFYNICSTINKGNDYILPITFRGYETLLDEYMDSFGFKFFNKKLGKGDIDNPVFSKAVDFEKKIRELEAYAYGTKGNDWEMDRGLFAFNYESFNLKDYESILLNCPNIGITNLPIGNEDGFFRGDYLFGCISKKSKAKESSFEFLKILVSEGMQEMVSERLFGYNPINKDVLNSYMNNIPEEKREALEYIFKKTKFSYESPKSEAFSSAFKDKLLAKFTKGESVDSSSLKDINKEVEMDFKNGK